MKLSKYKQPNEVLKVAAEDGKIGFFILTDDSIICSGFLDTFRNIKSIALTQEGAIIGNKTSGFWFKKNSSPNTLLGNQPNPWFLFEFKLDKKERVVPLEKGAGLSFLCGKKTLFVPLRNGIHFKKNRIESIEHLILSYQSKNKFFLDKGAFFRDTLSKILVTDTKCEYDKMLFGEIPNGPTATIIILVNKSTESMRHQMAAFAGLGGIERVEIIYVIDNPIIHDEIRSFASKLHEIYFVPFRMLLLERHMGFGSATNIGASIANGDHLVLMNLEVIPKDNIWLDHLITYLNTTENIGVVGCRLLFEDGGIQHDGMDYSPPDLLGLKSIDHPGKGLPSQLRPNTEDFEPCSMVTSACMTMKTELFRELNGFDRSFFFADFEDADLCLRAESKGYVNHIAHDVCLYRFRQPSPDILTPSWKQNFTALNMLLFNERWNSDFPSPIDKIIEE